MPGEGREGGNAPTRGIEGLGSWQVGGGVATKAELVRGCQDAIWGALAGLAGDDPGVRPGPAGRVDVGRHCSRAESERSVDLVGGR